MTFEYAEVCPTNRGLFNPVGKRGTVVAKNRLAALKQVATIVNGKMTGSTIEGFDYVGQSIELFKVTN